MILGDSAILAGGSPLAKIIVTAPAGSTVTMSYGGVVTTGTEVGGTWPFGVKEYGEYIITATKDGRTITRTVEVAAAADYAITLRFEYTVSSVISSYTLSGSISSGSDKFTGAIGYGYDTERTLSGNGYAPSGSTAVVRYKFDLSSVPADAVVKAVVCKVKGRAESSSNSSEHCDCQLYNSSGVAVGSMISFKSTGTTLTVIELNDSTGWTAQELINMELRVTVGYYGGAIYGATVFATIE